MLKVLINQLNGGRSTAPHDLTQKGLGIAGVDKKFHPVLGGRVRYKGSFWPAFTDQDESFKEQDIVRVLGIIGISLQVEKYC